MPIQNLDFGTPADNDGETLKTAFPKIQGNFEDHESRVTDLENAPPPVTDYNDLTNKPTLGTAASQNTGTSGGNVPLLNGANTWSSQQTLSAALNLSSGQVAFPATQIPSADPNTLDDYEEGTWTPTVFGGTTAGTSTQTTQLGKYVKIGSIVAFYFRVVFNSHTGTGQARISGLPFTATATSPCAIRFSSTSFTGNPQSLVVSGSTQIYFEHVTSGSGAVALPLGTSGDFNMAGTYFA